MNKINKNHYLLICLIFFLGFNSIWAQYTNYRVSPVGQSAPEEVTIAINPADPLNLSAGANIRYHYYSKDGGYTWKGGTLASSYGVHGDPCVTYDAKGNVYYSHLSNPGTYQGSWLDRIVIQRSGDGGETWTNGAGVGLNGSKDQDKEWMIADITNSSYRDNLYISWTQFDRYGSKQPQDSSRIMFSCSRDSGKTWTVARSISDHGGNCVDNDNTVEGAVPAVGPNGEVYIAWSGPLGIMLDRSFDGGITFGKDIFVSDQNGGWDQFVYAIDRCNGMPITVCDISNSIHEGSLYIVWSDKRNGNLDIFIAKSTDRGDTWSAPLQINNDQTMGDQFFPWAAVDPVTGSIYVVFYDRRNHVGGADTDVYLAKSHDGGLTFENIKISESSFMPESNVFFGDYINIAAYNGFVHPIWTRLDQGTLSVWTAVIHDTAAFTTVNQIDHPLDFQLSQNYPNPFNPETTINFHIDKSEHVSLKVFDITGSLVQTLEEGILTVGSYETLWNGRDQHGTQASSGIYFYQLKSGNKFIQKKMILLK